MIEVAAWIGSGVGWGELPYEVEGAPGERDEASTAMWAFGRGGVAGGSCFGGRAGVGDGKIIVIMICGGGGNGTEELLCAQQAGVHVAGSE